jgi:hypothetical protein
MATFPVDDSDPSIISFGSLSAWGRYSENLAYNRTLTWLASGGTAKISFVGVVMPKSGSVRFFEDFCEPGTGPMVRFRQMSEPWTGP